MKIGTMRRLNPDPTVYDGLMHRIVESAQRIEAAGFPGIWVGDSLGRGRPTLDPLVALGAIAAVTDRGEPVNTGGTLSNFPGCEGGPPIRMGALGPLQQLGRPGIRDENIPGGWGKKRRTGQRRHRSGRPPWLGRGAEAFETVG